MMAPIGGTGYGVAGWNILDQLCKQNVEVALTPMGQPHAESQDQANTLSICINRGESDFNAYAPCLRVWHQFDLSPHIGHGTYYAFPFFELDTFTKREQLHITVPDVVMVTSKWAEDIVKKYIKDFQKTVVVPLGIDPDIFYPRRPNQNDKFTIGNFGKWEKRKGHDIISEVFNDAFSPKDDVCLRMFPSNPFLNASELNDWERIYMDSNLGYRIHIMPRMGTHKILADYMSQIDLGFFPSRAEGWNLELLEVMAMGKHVITTDCTAHTAYATEGNATLIHIDETELAHDGKWFFGQGSWAKLGKDQLDAMVEALRASYKKWQTNPAEFINHAGIETGKRLTWANTARIISEKIQKFG